MNELFFHECRAAGLVFKTSNDWCKWLTDNSYGNEVTTGKVEGFLFIPSAEGVTIENKKGFLPSSSFIVT